MGARAGSHFRGCAGFAMKREYPEAPIAGVGAVIVREGRDAEQQVLLVRRAHWRHVSRRQWPLACVAVRYAAPARQ